ncbi:MAG: DUF72 domain-containing protein [Planctomycetes bacterium]|nr:DUF72 domain-containing protein [Planctomycetota bacterium]
MTEAARKLRIGTSSWSESSWVGSFYPAGTKPADFLTRYASVFDTVEADVTYYRIPSRDMVRGWDRKTPAGFTLAAKFPRSIVHGGDGPRPDGARVLVPEIVADDTQRFLEVMGLLGPKCGPLVLQFPYFNREAFASAAPFLERLDAYLGELPQGFRYAVEVRNKGWLGAPLLDVLRRHGAALVLVDLLYMPHPAELADTLNLVTADFVYARLIGDRKQTDELSGKVFDHVVIDQRPRLVRWAELLQALAPEVSEMFAYANNHYAGHGPATAAELLALVKGEAPPAAPPRVASGELPF